MPRRAGTTAHSIWLKVREACLLKFWKQQFGLAHSQSVSRPRNCKRQKLRLGLQLMTTQIVPGERRQVLCTQRPETQEPIQRSPETWSIRGLERKS